MNLKLACSSLKQVTKNKWSEIQVKNTSKKNWCETAKSLKSVILTTYEEYTEFCTLNMRKEGEITSLNKLVIQHKGRVKFDALILRRSTRLKLGEEYI